MPISTDRICHLSVRVSFANVASPDSKLRRILSEYLKCSISEQADILYAFYASNGAFNQLSAVDLYRICCGLAKYNIPYKITSVGG